MNLVDEIEQLVILGETEKALSLMKDIFVLSEKEFHTEVIVLHARYNRLASKKRKKTILAEVAEIEINEINEAVIELLNEIKEDPAIMEPYLKTKENLQSARSTRNITYHDAFEGPLIKRLSIFRENFGNKSFEVLRIAKNPALFDKYEGNVIKQMGIKLEYATTSLEAEEKITTHSFDAVITSVERENRPDEGFRFHKQLIDRGIDIPFIFYIGFVKREKGVPPYAFGITHDPTELIHLLLDVLERK